MDNTYAVIWDEYLAYTGDVFIVIASTAHSMSE